MTTGTLIPRERRDLARNTIPRVELGSGFILFNVLQYRHCAFNSDTLCLITHRAGKVFNDNYVLEYISHRCAGRETCRFVIGREKGEPLCSWRR